MGSSITLDWRLDDGRISGALQGGEVKMPAPAAAGWPLEEAAGDRTGSFDNRDNNLPAFSSVPSRKVKRGGSGGVSAAAGGAIHDYHYQPETFFEMDVTLPLHWESLTGKKGQHKLAKSSDSQDFEFNMAGNNPLEQEDEKEISPADDLFYKGQLLPLHLPKRLQMVQKLSSPKSTSTSTTTTSSAAFKDKGDPSGVTVSCFFQPSLKYSSLASDESYMGSALVNSRSSSFHSQGSKDFWESDSPGEADTGDSSSSRDSSGSSQDACVSAKQSPRGVGADDHVTYNSNCSGSKDRRFFQHRDFFSHHSLRAERSLFASWLRSHFKWKMLFSLRRNSKSRNSNDSSGFKDDLEERDEDGGKGSNLNLNKKQLPREAAPPLEGLPSLKFTRSSKSTTCSSDQKSACKKELFSSRPGSDLAHTGLFTFPPSDGGVFVKEKLESSERSVSASRARESLTKYLSILKPSNGRGQRTSEASDSNGCRVVDIGFSGDLSAAAAASSSPKHSLFSSGLPSPRSSSKSSSDKKPPAMHSLSGNLRVPSFSRSSKASASAGTAAARAASPTHSGLLPRSSPSTMAELHSAIQGAIAHCKQSHAAGDDVQ
ncbi:hypothetical protein R1sor_023996 [Riccia sorocarpa]|uniref:Uncharacterized protein n=1 Tax=Riccia sorocarpa TaxID=122646 RepID=A0ABD3GSH4_9MARC